MGGGGGGVEGVEVRVREGETEGRRRERVIYSESFTHRNCLSLSSWGKVGKKTSDKEVIR